MTLTLPSKTWIVVPFFVAACSSSPPPTETLGATTSHIQSGDACSLSREQILGSVSGARVDILQRAFHWVDDDVPYSQSDEYEGYRTDCSGFVSMCWDAGEPGETTASFPDSGKVQMLDSFDDLVPGDAIDAPGHHVVLFVGWDDPDHTGICTIEQESTDLGMQFHVRSTDSMQDEYQPMRLLGLSDDTATPTGGASGTNGTGGTGPAKRPSKKTPPPAPASGDDDDAAN